MDTQITTTEESKHPQRSSQADLITKTKLRMIGEVLDRWRLNLGWTPQDSATQQMAALSWIRVLDQENVPADCYHALFDEALKLRALMLSNGKNPPDMGVELLLANWPAMQKRIQDEMKQKQRTLSENAAGACERCFGTGIETVPHQGARRCDHGREG